MTGKQLKNSILQLAIQGKLVPQDPHDEPASELLKRIRKEKEQLVKTGKLKKKDLESTPIAEDEKPFEIPESWEWVRMNSIFNFIDYRGKTPNKIASGVTLITATNIKEGYLDFTQKSYISYAEFETRKSRGITQKGDILFTTEAPMGHAAINTVDECSCGQRIITFQAYLPLLSNSLFCYYILSSFFQSQILDRASGMTATGIKGERVKDLLLPLPPLSEQHRIVEKIEELMPLVEEYDKAQSELDKLNESLPEQLKKSILQQAIMGKLVPQDPNDEPASELLKRIHKEKENLVKSGALKKKDLITTPISDDEKPFDIPESWEWVSLESVIYQVGNKYNQVLSSEIQKEGLIPVVSQGQKLVDGYTDQIVKRIEDIPLVLFGDHTRNVKYIDFPFVIGADGVKLLKPIILSARFLYFWTLFSSSNLRDRGYARHYTLLKEVPFPLPPLPEQHRIVAKIEELFSILK